jgi:hypothetical protein
VLVAVETGKSMVARAPSDNTQLQIDQPTLPKCVQLSLTQITPSFWIREIVLIYRKRWQKSS